MFPQQRYALFNILTGIAENNVIFQFQNIVRKINKVSETLASEFVDSGMRKLMTMDLVANGATQQEIDDYINEIGEGLKKQELDKLMSEIGIGEEKKKTKEDMIAQFHENRRKLQELEANSKQ